MRRLLPLVLGAVLATVACESVAFDDDFDALDREPSSDAEAPDADAELPADADAMAEVEKKPVLAAGLEIHQVDLYQALRIPLVEKGKTVPPSLTSLPIVADRAAVIRVAVKPTSFWKRHSVKVVFTLEVKGKERRLSRTATPDAEDTTTFVFTLPAEDVTPGTRWKVEILDHSEGAREGTDKARWPRAEDERATLDAKRVKSPKILIVPVATTNGRTPTFDDATLDTFRRDFRRMYPIADVDLSLGPTFTYDAAFPTTGKGWSNLLDALAEDRTTLKVPDDTYVVGVFRPSMTSREYFKQYPDCPAGLGSIPFDERAYDWPEGRTNIVLGYETDRLAVMSMAVLHEVGHNHGRRHAPCGDVARPDVYFPHSSGGIGTWGYDSETKSYLNPSADKDPPRDFMSYCSPEWVSDYTYRHLFRRIEAIGAWTWTAGSTQHARYRKVLVGPQGELEMGSVVERRTINALDEAAELVDHRGRTQRVKGIFIPYDHLPGGVMLVPEAEGTTYVRGRLVRSLTAIEAERLRR